MALMEKILQPPVESPLPDYCAYAAVLLYSAALSLEFVALITLRLRAPEMSRPFRIPGGWFGVIVITLAPMFEM